MDTCRLRVKIGPYEMEAEGPRDFVEKHYGSFSERVPQNTQLATVPASSGQIPTPSDSLSESPLAAIFHQDGDGRRLSLTAKPIGDSAEVDAVLLLLLGHKELRGVEYASSDELLYGLKNSGYPVERADRIAIRAEDQGLLTRTGVRRGTRYRLTVPGTARARAVAEVLRENVT